MINTQWQQIHDLLIDISEGALRDGDPVASGYLQILVRLHNLYPDVANGISDDPCRTKAMHDIHEVVVSMLTDLVTSSDTSHS